MSSDGVIYSPSLLSSCFLPLRNNALDQDAQKHFQRKISEHRNLSWTCYLSAKIFLRLSIVSRSLTFLLWLVSSFYLDKIPKTYLIKNCNLVNIFYEKQCKPLNLITLVQWQTDNINQMITITKFVIYGKKRF